MYGRLLAFFYHRLAAKVSYDEVSAVDNEDYYCCCNKRADRITDACRSEEILCELYTEYRVDNCKNHRDKEEYSCLCEK